jgi:hypothetical protein
MIKWEHSIFALPFALTAAMLAASGWGSPLSGFLDQGRDLPGMLSFAGVSFVAAGIAGFFGAMINKYAPVQGGATIQLRQGE